VKSERQIHSSEELIQRFPQALLPLLSIKASATPNFIAQEVQCGLDLMASYLADRLEVQGAAQSAVSAPTTLTITVPAGEYWYLFNLSSSATAITAGSVVSLAVGIGDPSGANSYLASSDLTPATIATQSVVLAAGQSIPILLKPGMRLIGQLLVDPGVGTVDLDVRALVARLSPQ